MGKRDGVHRCEGLQAARVMAEVARDHDEVAAEARAALTREGEVRCPQCGETMAACDWMDNDDFCPTCGWSATRAVVGVTTTRRSLCSIMAVRLPTCWACRAARQ